jgi:hypothetical protein
MFKTSTSSTKLEINLSNASVPQSYSPVTLINPLGVSQTLIAITPFPFTLTLPSSGVHQQ